MTEVRGLPPGRAGRLWLLKRLRAGRLAADLLDRKLRVLRLEQERFRLIEERTRARWQTTWREADQWILRAAVLGGQRDARLSAPRESAAVAVTWASVMGVRYPVEATCHLPENDAAARGPGSTALVAATAAYRTAIQAAVAYAAADAACRVVDAEITATRRRLHAITDRHIPRLETALRDLTRELDESERAETFRMRWAVATSDLGGAPR
jgi:V/A-type H+-transporting ATPase subunit D